MKKEMTQERLKEVLEHDGDTGEFAWKVSGNGRRKGMMAGTLNSSGYRQIKIDGKRYMAHRLAWLYIYGEFPEHQIDHIDHDKANNRIENLRSVTHQENARNSSLSKNNSSGINGVSWHKVKHKWQAQITIDSKKIHLGYFTDLDQAITARKEANIKYNFHSNHGSITT